MVKTRVSGVPYEVELGEKNETLNDLIHDVDGLISELERENFMRNVRMMMPQYITNVTSFKDAVKILKNKAILTEGDLNRNAELGGVENDFKNLLAKGYSYSEALELLAQNTGMDPDELESMFPQDAVDVEGHEGDLTEYYDPEEKYAASYKGRIWGVIENEYPDISAEVFEDIKDYMDNTTERNLKDKFENPLDAAKQIVAMFSGNEDADIEDMISRGEEEEAGKYTKFQDFEGGLSEEYTDEPTYEYNGKTLYVDNQSGEPDAPGGTVDLYDEDDTRYTATISSIDREGFIYVDPKSIQVVDDQFYPEDEDYEDPDMFDAYGMDASESLKNMDEGYYGWDDPSDKTSYDLERLHDYINQRYEKESGEEIPYESFEEIEHEFAVRTGAARPAAKSEQDAIIDGKYFITRYVYAGSFTHDNMRPFCKKMIEAGKLYRMEDIVAMEDVPVNPGWGPNGDDVYDIWRFKGGGNCRHFWEKRVFVDAKGAKINPNDPDAKRIAVSMAERMGYKVRNNALVAKLPEDMPYNGFLPTNPIYGNQ